MSSYIRQSKSRTMPKAIALLSGIVICLMCSTTSAVAAASFDAQRKTIVASPATQTEAAIVSMLRAGLAENKPTQAFATAQLWLRQNVAENPLLLYHAGQAAELSSEWRDAVALYRQYLKRADLKSASANDAVLAVYTLLINQLDDANGAYAFSRSEGQRLVVSTQARQFDRWFLDEAKRRRDHEAVAMRLLALVQGKVDNDLLAAQHDSDFSWLLIAINDGRLDQKRYSKRFVESVKGLSKAITFDKELGLLLDWSVSVKTYNRAILEGEQVALPIAEAEALLSAYPRYAERVQTGWAASRGRYYRGDPKKYWPLDLEAKLAPVKRAVAKLGPVDQAHYLQSLSTRYYDGYPQLLNAEQARTWVLANPKLANSKTAPVLAFGWNKLTSEDAKKLAPLLERNPSPEAALIRAIAAADDGTTKNLDKAADVLLTAEAWRLGTGELGGSYADQLWHWAGRPDGNAKRDQLIARSKKLADSIKANAVKKVDPANKRLAEFKKLWQDYRSNQPKLPAVRERLMQVLFVTPEAMTDVLRDTSPEAQLIAQSAIDTGFLADGTQWEELYRFARLSTRSYGPSIAKLAPRHGGYASLKQRYPDRYKPHPLHEPLERTLSEQLKKGRVEPWLAMAWINATFIEKSDASVKLMAELVKSPVFKSLPFQVRYGARDWFKAIALTPAQLAYITASDVNLICKPLSELPEDADAATTASALKAAIEGLRKSPVHCEIVGIERLGKIDEAIFADTQVLEQLYKLAGPMRSFTTDHTVAYRLYKIVSKELQPDVLHQVGPYLWRDVQVHHRLFAQMKTLIESLTKEHPSAASALARTGLQTIARHSRGHTWFKIESDVPLLKAARGKAAIAMGLIDIPVPASDPAYSIYKSQAEFILGNQESAQELYAANANQLLPVHRKLSPAYLLWVLQRTIDARDQENQEALIKALITWSQAAPAFSLEQKIQLEIAYGDIAMQRGMLPEAQKIFAGIQNNKAYEGVFLRHTATLRRVRVERISKDFDGALKTLAELELNRIPRLTTDAHHARAQVYYDMEEYEDAAEEIAMVLQRDPTHSDATILRGRVQLKLKRLLEATEVELGANTSQSTLVPGEILKVTLNDPTLAVSSGGSEIEVVVWATSGDKEHLLLRQFGDVKTKYRGEIRTALGKPVSGDRTLQIIGDDEIFYAYSQAFRKKVSNLGENRGGPITIASDAVLMASARKLLSEAEQRVADMAAVTAVIEKKQLSAGARSNPEMIAQLKAEAAESARRAMLMARAKPGNPIHVRVIDPDGGRTAEIDELVISAFSSSGDSIGRVVLKETGTHTGQFEGTVPTTGAQAMAFASSSETGRNPNMVISPKTTYDAWRPVPIPAVRAPAIKKNHMFAVDLNDNAPLGSLEIDASDAGFGLKSFLVQTAMNHKRWTTVGRYQVDLHPKPKAEGLPEAIAIPKVWKPSIVVMNDNDRFQMGGRPTVYALQELEHHLEQGWMTQRFPQGIARNVGGPSQAMPASIPTALKWKRHQQHDCPHIVYRFRGWFYEHADVTRRFRLALGKHVPPKDTHSSLSSAPKFLLAVDGRPITEEEGGKLDGTINLRAGLHRFEIWGIGWVQTTFGFGRTTTLQANLEGEDKLVDCPDSFFNPETFPVGVLEHRNAPAKLATSKDGKKFTVKFAPDSRARLLRIVFIDQEGPVPSLNHLALTNAKGGKLLPAPQDFAALRKNDLLEILTGDKVSIRYVDERFVTKSKQKHERLLHVSFTNGKIEFADIEPRYSSRHRKKMPYRERLLRFPFGKPLSVVVNDADMDVSVEPDQVKITLESKVGGKRSFTATETGASTGTFRCFVNPVNTATTDKTQIQVSKTGTLLATYRDAENASPGVPFDRTATIKHAAYQTPAILIAHMDVTPVKVDMNGASHTLISDFVPAEISYMTGRQRAVSERIRPRFEITQKFVGASNAPANSIELVHGRHAMIDIVAPQLALGVASSVNVYVQTDAGRKQAGVADSAKFNTNIPGTLKLVGTLGLLPRTGMPQLAGYIDQGIVGDGGGRLHERLQQRYEQGRFRVRVPLVPDVLPEHSYVDPETIRELKLRRPYGLVAKAGERIHIGVSFKDRSGDTQWVTASATVTAQSMLDVMAENYRRRLTQAFVGEKLNLRVIDFGQDRTDARDELQVYMMSKSGQKHHVTLRETEMHSGIFKGTFQLVYASSKAVQKVNGAGEAPQPVKYDVRRFGFPVIYGDAVGVRYTNAAGLKTPVQFITIGKGSDGTIAPFSKQYTDSETAMQTQFAMAESFLELARRHRKTGEEKQAQLEFARAKQLLANAISQFNDPETRAHAEYLLGNLTQEEAGAATDKDLQEQRYHAALARFMKVTGTYPDTEYASKAQFKIAYIYERLNEPDIAAQEYVKLAYKYPESEHLATAMARLGTHFQRKAVQYEREAAPLLKMVEDKDAEYKGIALQKLSHIEYVKSAQIFARLQSRFPGHELAGKAGLRAGQIYMRALKYKDAITALMRVVNDENYDGATLRSEAMYWTARCHQTLNAQLSAYALYKRITYDFPESKWAAYARGQLSQESMLKLDQKLEIERLEDGR